MSATMLRQMLADAAAALKAERFQEAADASRRVTQFDPNNFQAFMCVGLASFQLKEWEDCEDAYRRAAELKPDLPAPWKNLVDLFEARGDLKSKLEPLEKLVPIFQRTKKFKACQKWVAEIATTSMELKLLPKAFDAWYSLVGESQGDMAHLSLEATPNDELPSPLAIWLDLVDLLQRPGFTLSECSGTYSMAAISSQFFAAASRCDWSCEATSSATRSRMDSAIAFFMRLHLDELKTSKKKAELLETLDALALSIISWFPAAKIPAEFLLLRSEDQDSPIDMEKAREIATTLAASHLKSPMVHVFQAVECLERKENAQAQEHFTEALASCSSSSFHESALCIRTQVELAALALAACDIEGCLQRLALARKTVADKAQALGCKSPLPSLYSEAKVQFLAATAHEYSSDIKKALEGYRSVMQSGDTVLGVQAALAAAELLAPRKQIQEALEALDLFPVTSVEDEGLAAALSCTRGWLLFESGELQDAQALLEKNVPMIPVTDTVVRGRSLKRLAIVYWHLGGAYQQDKTRCFGHLLQAAKLTPTDAEIFAWLGRWYQSVASDVLRAEKCFLKALSLSPTNELAGTALCDLYDQQNKQELNVKLWESATRDSETAPTWALLRLAQHLVEQDDELAVGKMHLVLRNDPLNARYWVILAHVYRSFGKQVSAQKSYLKAIELGENSWCVRCELARIEGTLRLFDDAMERIEPLVVGSSGSNDAGDAPDVTVASMIYADLLFQQAKSLCAEGLYGRAAANLKRASEILKGLPSSSSLSGSLEACKLIGDVHCFAFYLSPGDFGSSEGKTWVAFISEGRKAYEAVVLLAKKLQKQGENADAYSDTVTAEMYYDIGLGYWYEAQAVSNSHGIPLQAFNARVSNAANEEDAVVHGQVVDLRTKAATNFKLALEQDPGCAAAWNGLALVHDNVLVKQFAWARAVQTGSSSDATWANLGMFYLSQADAAPGAALLAQKAFLQLQSMNPDNPSMWNGYAMLARRQATDSSMQQTKTIEAFDCALEVGLDLDALLGLTMALLEFEDSVGAAVTQAPEHSSEQMAFYLKKYLERDPFNARAWHALGVAQHRLGLYSEALTSYTHAISPTAVTGAALAHRGLEWNTLVSEIGVLSSERHSTDTAALSQKLSMLLEQTTDVSPVLRSVLQIQLLYHQSKEDAALDLMTKLLQQSEEDLQPVENQVVALVGLSIASLVQDKCGDKATAVAMACKTRFVSANSFSEVPVAVTSREHALDLRLVELHERLVGDEDACLERLQLAAQTSDDPQFNSSAAWTRLALVSIDSQRLQVSNCVNSFLRSGSRSEVATGENTADRSFLDALVSLLKAGPAESTQKLPLDAQKLVRMQPWSPRAYVLAGASVLKRVYLEEDAKAHSEVLRQLTRLLESGLALAEATAGAAFDAAQLELFMGYCYAGLGEQEKSQDYAMRSLVRIRAWGQRSADSELLEARVLMLSNPDEAVEKYVNVIASVSASDSTSSDRLVPILSELGGVYEELERLDAAIQVWRLVTSLTSSSKAADASESNDDESSTTTALATSSDTSACFLANLRLALIHGKKKNLKSARKHMKAAVALAEVGDADPSAATVAAFVESVLAKAI